MNITAYLIDDEAHARRELRYLLEQIGNVTIVGEAAEPALALQGICETKPQLLFLDIHLPDLNGIELSRVIRDMQYNPLIVFATAYEQFALDAFNVEAFDYILKPFTQERVSRTVQKARMFLGTKPVEPATAESSDDKSDSRRVLVYRNGKMIPILPENIVFISSTDGRTLVYTAEETYTSKRTLNILEEALKKFSFLRVHRTTLINLNCIVEIIPWFSGSYKLVMNDRRSSEVLVSRYNAKDFKKRLILNP